MRERLLAAMGGLPKARWQNDDQLHLTLRFIGEVDRHMANDVAAALGSVHHPRFALALDGIGHFGRRGRIESLWSGVTPHDAVTALHRKVDQALTRVGVPADRRAFLPHITIARFRAGAALPEGSLREQAGLNSEPYELTEFCLYESDLSAEGASYTIAERYRLG